MPVAAAMGDDGGDRDITGLLAALRRGESSAMELLIPLVYDELRRRARRQLARRRGDGTLDTTGLVHEVYLRLAGSAGLGWADRNHFFGVAVKAMRSIVVDGARQRGAGKRGGSLRRIEL